MRTIVVLCASLLGMNWSVEKKCQLKQDGEQAYIASIPRIRRHFSREFVSIQQMNNAIRRLSSIPSARHQGLLFSRGFCGDVAKLRAGHW